MENLALQATKRDTNTKLADVRVGGERRAIPAVVYGHKFKSTAITVDYSEFLRLFRTSGHSTIVSLQLDGKAHDVLVHEIQRHPVTDDFIHIDFIAIIATEKVHTSIELKLIGESPAQREGAVVQQSLQELDVKCLPKYLVHEFEVDISKLEKAGDIIHVDDLGLDTEKYDITVPGETPIASAHEPRTQEEEDVVEVSEESTEGE